MKRLNLKKINELKVGDKFMSKYVSDKDTGMNWTQKDIDEFNEEKFEVVDINEHWVSAMRNGNPEDEIEIARNVKTQPKYIEDDGLCTDIYSGLKYYILK